MSDPFSVMRIDARVRRIPLVLELESGDVNAAIVTMNGNARDNFMSQMLKRSKTDGSGAVIGIKDPNGMFSDLLTKTLENEDTGALFKREEIQGLPAPVSKELFEMAKTLNGLSDDEDDDDENEVGKDDTDD